MPPSRFLIYLSAVLIVCALALPLQAEDQPPRSPVMSLIGSGEVTAKPDMALVMIGVSRRAGTAREALTQNNTAMTEILDYLKQAGIAAKDIQTTNFMVTPVYVYDDSNKQPPKITGYEVSNQVAVVVRKLDDLGGVLDQAVTKGSNQMNGINFSIADPEPLEDQARRLAVADASRKAKLYAEAAGVSLGRIVSIAEHMPSPPQPIYMKAQRMEAADGSVPVAEGEQSVAVQVNISWEIR